VLDNPPVDFDLNFASLVEQRGGEVVKVARTVEMPDSMAAAEACQRDFNMVPDTAEKKLALAYYYANM
jgi:hypothetical protein